MCGFAGLLDARAERSCGELTGLARAMADALVHRGPDDEGVFVDALAGVALGFRRLAVIDLSEGGSQPMLSASGRFVLAYNGEIYNFESLRTRLEALGARWRGRSDTEVLLAAIDTWGLDQALREVNGMFAFALWDRRERRLELVRDRLGEKPLYFAWIGNTFVFGSELKSLRALPEFRPVVDRHALARYFQLSRVPAPSTIYEGVRQVEPGSVLTVSWTDSSSRSQQSRRYWSAAEVASRGALDPVTGDEASVVDQVEELLADAVGLRTHADVPVGVFLSGGVDSSAVAAMMVARSTGTVRTFTIGFEDLGYDESGAAAAVARHLGTEHVCVRLTAADALAVVDQLPRIYDDPFADPSQIPTFLVSRVAREHVTVSLSGDGGDELFGGYNRHAWAKPILRATGHLPTALKSAATRALLAPDPASWDRWFARYGALLPKSARLRIPGTKAQKLAAVLPATGPEDLYRVLSSTWGEPERLVLGISDSRAAYELDGIPAGLDDVAAQMMFLDLVGYLPDDILVKLDRASMAVSLESRVPMLDHRLVELAWRVPVDLKIRNRRGKWVLREVLRRHVPEELVNRPKAGFGLPIDTWLRGPLRPWAEQLLDRERLEAEGYLDPVTVRSCWDQHMAGDRDFSDQLWAVLMFQRWLETYLP